MERLIAKASSLGYRQILKKFREINLYVAVSVYKVFISWAEDYWNLHISAWFSKDLSKLQTAHTSISFLFNFILKAMVMKISSSMNSGSLKVLSLSDILSISLTSKSDFSLILNIARAILYKILNFSFKKQSKSLTTKWKGSVLVYKVMNQPVAYRIGSTPFNCYLINYHIFLLPYGLPVLDSVFSWVLPAQREVSISQSDPWNSQAACTNPSSYT